MPEFQDRVLKCVECGADFVFTAGEQHFFHDKNFKNEPKRCKNCKLKRQGSQGSGFTKSETTTSRGTLALYLTGFATFRFVLEALVVEEVLLSRGKYKIGSAIHTLKGAVLEFRHTCCPVID